MSLPRSSKRIKSSPPPSATEDGEVASPEYTPVLTSSAPTPASKSLDFASRVFSSSTPLSPADMAVAARFRRAYGGGIRFAEEVSAPLPATGNATPPSPAASSPESPPTPRVVSPSAAASDEDDDPLVSLAPKLLAAWPAAYDNPATNDDLRTFARTLATLFPDAFRALACKDVEASPEGEPTHAVAPGMHKSFSELLYGAASPRYPELERATRALLLLVLTYKGYSRAWISLRHANDRSLSARAFSMRDNPFIPKTDKSFAELAVMVFYNDVLKNAEMRRRVKATMPAAALVASGDDHDYCLGWAMNFAASGAATAVAAAEIGLDHFFYYLRRGTMFTAANALMSRFSVAQFLQGECLPSSVERFKRAVSTRRDQVAFIAKHFYDIGGVAYSVLSDTFLARIAAAARFLVNCTSGAAAYAAYLEWNYGTLLNFSGEGSVSGTLFGCDAPLGVLDMERFEVSSIEAHAWQFAKPSDAAAAESVSRRIAIARLCAMFRVGPIIPPPREAPYVGSDVVYGLNIIEKDRFSKVLAALASLGAEESSALVSHLDFTAPYSDGEPPAYNGGDKGKYMIYYAPALVGATGADNIASGLRYLLAVFNAARSSAVTTPVVDVSAVVKHAASHPVFYSECPPTLLVDENFFSGSSKVSVV